MRIDLICYDFDGVMTDNRVIVDENGKESVICNRGDGLGVNYFRRLRIPQLILSTEMNQVVFARANKLDISCIHGCGDKARELTYYCIENKYELDNVMYVGNDINDLEAMKMVGWPVCPADAHREIQAISIRVTDAKGGEGVIRELADWHKEMK